MISEASCYNITVIEVWLQEQPRNRYRFGFERIKGDFYVDYAQEAILLDYDNWSYYHGLAF
jgi:hypothetical protein